MNTFLIIVVVIACASITFKVFYDISITQEKRDIEADNRAKYAKYLDMIDALLPKLCPQIFPNESPSNEVTGMVTSNGMMGLVPDAETLDRLAEFELRSLYRRTIDQILESHSYQIDVATAAKYATKILLDLNDLQAAPLPPELLPLLKEVKTDESGNQA